MNDMDIQDSSRGSPPPGRPATEKPSWPLWHPRTGCCIRRLMTGRWPAGELGRLTELVRETAPDHVWQLLD